MSSAERTGWRELVWGMAAITALIALLSALAAILMQEGLGKKEPWPAVGAAAVTVWVSALASFLPMVIWSSRSPTAGVYACFGGSALRLGLCMMGAIGWVAGAKLDVTVVGLSIVMFYLPTLAVEAGLMARWLWKLDFRAGNGPGAGMEAKG